MHVITHIRYKAIHLRHSINISRQKENKNLFQMVQYNMYLISSLNVELQFFHKKAF